MMDEKINMVIGTMRMTTSDRGKDLVFSTSLPAIAEIAHLGEV